MIVQDKAVQLLTSRRVGGTLFRIVGKQAEWLCATCDEWHVTALPSEHSLVAPTLAHWQAWWALRVHSRVTWRALLTQSMPPEILAQLEVT